MAKVTPQRNKIAPSPATPPGGKPSPAQSTPAAAPAKGFQPGTPGLGKFRSNPALRATLFRAPSGVGLNRASDILGPNKMTVGALMERIGEHLEDPQSPTAQDLALMNGAFNVLE